MKSMWGVSIANVRTLSWSSITICLVGRKRIENIWVFYHVCLVERIKKWKHGKLITIIPILFLKSAGNLDILPSSSFLSILERTFVGHERKLPHPHFPFTLFSLLTKQEEIAFSLLFSLLHFTSSLKKLQPNALLVSGLFTSHTTEERWEANAPNSLFTTCAPYNYWLSCFIFSSSSSDSSTGCIRSATLGLGFLKSNLLAFIFIFQQ